MGRILTQHKHIISAVLLGLLSLGAFTPWTFNPQAFTATAQTTPIISTRPTLARDANTFEDDKALNLACRQSRGTASSSEGSRDVCLCVTHVLKYELTLAEYRAAVRLYGKAQDRETLRQTLQSQGLTASEITKAEEMERTLVGSDDFAQRCANAKAYYKRKRR